MQPTALDLNTIAIIATLLAQIGGVIWWAATVNRRMTDIEEDISAVKKDQDSLAGEQRNQERALSGISVTMARLDERTGAMATALSTNFDNLNSRLNALDQRLGPSPGK